MPCTMQSTHNAHDISSKLNIDLEDRSLKDAFGECQPQKSVNVDESSEVKYDLMLSARFNDEKKQDRFGHMTNENSSCPVSQRAPLQGPVSSAHLSAFQNLNVNNLQIRAAKKPCNKGPGCPCFSNQNHNNVNDSTENERMKILSTRGANITLVTNNISSVDLSRELAGSTRPDLTKVMRSGLLCTYANNNSVHTQCANQKKGAIHKFTMLLRKVKQFKKPVFIVALVLLFFILGATVPTLWNRRHKDDEDSGSPKIFQPVQIFMNQYSFNHDHRPEADNNSENFEPLNLQLDPVKDFLKNIFITVKTTTRYHYPRLIIQLETWVSLVRDQTWFFTDHSEEEDAELKLRTGNHIIYTNCSSKYQRLSLCCKMEQEFQYFLHSHKSWWCHFDDDNYVNVLALANLLKRYNSSQPWYIGRTSTEAPLTIRNVQAQQNTSFWFATGGAGFCVSRTLALKMAPYAMNGKFVEAGNQYWFPDDVTLGYIIEKELETNLTVDTRFHSHLEKLHLMSKNDISSAISLSYSTDFGEDHIVRQNGPQHHVTGQNEGRHLAAENVITIPGPFPPKIDPTRFYSLHCFLFGGAFCPSLKNS